MVGNGTTDPHAGSREAHFGESLDQAPAAVILLHGRGASPEDILSLAVELDLPSLAYRAPAATGGAWYPHSFLAPLEANQPWLDSALARVAKSLERVAQAGIALDKTVLAGFSQGACLVLEYAYRNPARFGALIGLSGGLIGPKGHTWPVSGSFEGTPVLLACSDVDPHIPLERVTETGQRMRSMEAIVDERIFPGMGHLVNQDEIELMRTVLKRLETGDQGF
jgi:predicted esterase